MTYIEYLGKIKAKMLHNEGLVNGVLYHGLSICSTIDQLNWRASASEAVELSTHAEKLKHAVKCELRKLGTMGTGYYPSALQRAGKLRLSYSVAEAQAARHALLDRLIAEEQHENHSDN